MPNAGHATARHELIDAGRLRLSSQTRYASTSRRSASIDPSDAAQRVEHAGWPSRTKLHGALITRPAGCAHIGKSMRMRNGLFKSTVFPGLWLDASALLRLDVRHVMATLQHGIETPEHAAFVQQLQARHSAS